MTVDGHKLQHIKIASNVFIDFSLGSFPILLAEAGLYVSRYELKRIFSALLSSFFK